MTLNLTGDEMCFACGRLNPIGLKLEFESDGVVCRTTFTPTDEHQGWNGYMHGGIISTILDEVMAQWLHLKGYKTMTAEMTVRFKKPVPVSVTVTAISRLVSRKKRLFQLEGELFLPGGELAASATSKFLLVGKPR
ncbi:MAG TPA: PaaI family thioesterase [Clostridia bacterium]|nr:PaaI family thioesterase [Clostridia bacterium]